MTDAAPPAVTVHLVPWDDPDADLLRADQQAELAVRYDGEGDIEPVLPPEQMLATVLVRVAGEAAACGSLRAAEGYGPGTGEIKRMYVRPDHRGRGLARLVLGEVERAARAAGLSRLILETGVRQPEAIGLYLTAGYRPMPRFGPYADEELSVCFERSLGDPAEPALRVPQS